MTLPYEKNLRCALCENEATFTGILSTNELGSPDLDTRPSQMRRSSIFAWVQRCPVCGYCASDVSKVQPEFESLICEDITAQEEQGHEATAWALIHAAWVCDSDEYRRQLIDNKFPELANSFLCKAIIDQEAQNYKSAAWALIHAAWVCDDAALFEKAVICRDKAADMLITAEQHDQQIGEQDVTSTAILIDLLRRSGRMDDATRAIAKRRLGITEDIILRILDFQASLILKGDMLCYTISEALKHDA